jgi:hypothetical protein
MYITCRSAIFRTQLWYLTRAVDINRRMWVCFPSICTRRLTQHFNSGLSALSSDRSIYAFTNLLDGIELYSSTTLAHRYSIAQAVDPHNNLALGVVITGNRYVFAGCSGGRIWMYDQDTGKTIARLQNPNSLGELSFRKTSMSSNNVVKQPFRLWRWAVIINAYRPVQLMILARLVPVPGEISLHQVWLMVPYKSGNGTRFVKFLPSKLIIQRSNR